MDPGSAFARPRLDDAAVRRDAVRSSRYDGLFVLTEVNRHEVRTQLRRNVTFYVKKSLPHGPIRFGVSPRQPIEEIDSDEGLSTGSAGEFLRRSTHGYFFADSRPIGAPEMPKPSSLASMPFWAALKPEDARGWAFIGMMGFGAFLILWGVLVLLTLGAQGAILVILGAALLAVPIVIVAQKRRKIRVEEERVRAEFEERDRRNRESMTSYATALER